ncbi:MAG: hypothetical protein JWR83_934, partial [Aeromicrobium sp.]|nr:hypothetical protein [Aeromicrobium sp.]
RRELARADYHDPPRPRDRGQIAWLLEDKIDGNERARRYLVW